jgi:hypothetical protein
MFIRLTTAPNDSDGAAAAAPGPPAPRATARAAKPRPFKLAGRAGPAGGLPSRIEHGEAGIIGSVRTANLRAEAQSHRGTGALRLVSVTVAAAGPARLTVARTVRDSPRLARVLVS